jgi:hypothetical protein
MLGYGFRQNAKTLIVTFAVSQKRTLEFCVKPVLAGAMNTPAK